MILRLNRQQELVELNRRRDEFHACQHLCALYNQEDCEQCACLGHIFYDNHLTSYKENGHGNQEGELEYEEVSCYRHDESEFDEYYDWEQEEYDEEV